MLFFLLIRRPPRSTLFPYTDALPILGEGRPVDRSGYWNHDDSGGAQNQDRGKRVHGRWPISCQWGLGPRNHRSEEHTSELQSRLHLVCRLLLEKKKHKVALIAILPAQ